MSRIVVVEDEELLRRAITRGLRNYDVDPVVVGHYTEAIAVLKQGSVDMILTDVDGAGGLELWDEVSKIYPELATPTRFFFMTGAFTGSRVQVDEICRKHGLTVFQKPFHLFDIIQTMGIQGRAS